jgi:hypothetical protein
MSDEVEKLFGKLVDNVRLSSDENALGKVLEILHREKEISSVFKHINRSALRNASALRALDLAAYCRTIYDEEESDKMKDNRRRVQLRSVAKIANDALIEMSSEDRPKKKRRKSVGTILNFEICLYQLDVLNELEGEHEDVRDYLLNLIESIGMKNPSAWFGTDPTILYKVCSEHEKLASTHLNLLLEMKSNDDSLKSVLTSFDLDARLKAFLLRARDSSVCSLCVKCIEEWNEGTKDQKKFFLSLLQRLPSSEDDDESDDDESDDED